MVLRQRMSLRSPMKCILLKALNTFVILRFFFTAGILDCCLLMIKSLWQRMNRQTFGGWRMKAMKLYLHTVERKTQMPNSVKRGTSTKARISETKLLAILHVECCLNKTSTAYRTTGDRSNSCCTLEKISTGSSEINWRVGLNVTYSTTGGFTLMGYWIMHQHLHLWSNVSYKQKSRLKVLIKHKWQVSV